MSPPRTKYAISAGRSFDDSVNEIGNPVLVPVFMIGCGAELVKLIDVDDTEFDAEFPEVELEGELALDVETVNGAEPENAEFVAEVEPALPGLEPDILTVFEPEVVEIAGGEIVAGVETPPAILPAVLDTVAGSRSKNVSNSDSCAPLLESARVKACLAAIRPINNPNNEKHNAAMGVINESVFLSPYSKLITLLPARRFWNLKFQPFPAGIGSWERRHPGGFCCNRSSIGGRSSVNGVRNCQNQA